MKIDKIEIRNFKRFKNFKFFDIPNRCALAGANASGKTTLLQAVSTWAMICSEWLMSTNLQEARDNPEQRYSSVAIELSHFYSTPLARFSDLWTEGKREKPIHISLQTTKWKVGFNIEFKNQTSVEVYPHVKSKGKEDQEYLQKSLENLKEIFSHWKAPILYVPYFSTVQQKEERNEGELYVTGYLSLGHSGSVFRNLLVNARNNADKTVWEKLREIAKEYFDYELQSPSAPAGKNIISGYRHLNPVTKVSGTWLDFTTASSGFLQVMTIYASMLQNKGATILIDEPDAHLHPFLQERMLKDLREHAEKNKNQLIIATHNPAILNLFEHHQTGIIRDNKIFLAKKEEEQKDSIVDALSISNTHAAYAAQQKSILYVEGHTDQQIIHAWARTLNHRVAKFLDKGAWVEESKNRWGKNPGRHFQALKITTPDVLGFYLRDGDGRDLKVDEKVTKENGMMTFNWNWYSIESYLFNWKTIKRCLKEKGALEEDVKKAKERLKNILPLGIFNNPKKDNEAKFLKNTPSKPLMSGFLQGWAPTPPLDNITAVDIAQKMSRDDIPSEVEVLLDKIAGYLKISE